LLTGQEFERPFRNPPAMKVVDQVLVLLKTKLPDTFECELGVSRPRFEHPLVSGCQSFRVDQVTSEVKSFVESGKTIFGENAHGEVEEETSLLGNDVPRDAAKRRKFFSKKKNAEKFYFEPGLLYTFDFYCNFFCPLKYRLEVTPLFRPEVSPYFNGYPLFISVAKDKSTGEFFWATEVWHRRLLNFEDKPQNGVSRFFAFGRNSSKATVENKR